LPVSMNRGCLGEFSADIAPRQMLFGGSLTGSGLRGPFGLGGKLWLLCTITAGACLGELCEPKLLCEPAWPCEVSWSLSSGEPFLINAM
jgi:hypothetical protein